MRLSGGRPLGATMTGRRTPVLANGLRFSRSEGVNEPRSIQIIEFEQPPEDRFFEALPLQCDAKQGAMHGDTVRNPCTLDVGG